MFEKRHTLRQIAEMTGYSKNTLNSWIQNGFLKVERTNTCKNSKQLTTMTWFLEAKEKVNAPKPAPDMSKVQKPFGKKQTDEEYWRSYGFNS